MVTKVSFSVNNLWLNFGKKSQDDFAGWEETSYFRKISYIEHEVPFSVKTRGLIRFLGKLK